MSVRRCCCDGDDGDTFGSCDKIDCTTEYENEYCFEINGWKWFETIVYYARNLPQFGVRTHYDANGNPLPDNTPVWWLRMDGTFDIQGSVHVRGFDRERTSVFPADGCPNFDCPYVCSTGQKWYSGPPGDCYTTDFGSIRYSYSPTAANGQSSSELCDFDICDPLRATVGYAGTAHLQFRVFTEYRRGSASAPLVSTTTVNQSRTVDFPCLARTQCLTRNGVAGLETVGGPYNIVPNMNSQCQVPDSDRLFDWNTTGFPPESADDLPTDRLYTFRPAAPGCGVATAFVNRMFALFAPIGSGSPEAVPIDCSCPNGDKQRDWASTWNGVVPTTPAPTADDMATAYPNGLNSFGSLARWVRVHAFNTPSITWQTCTP